MSFSLVKPGGWAFGELLTSAQMNALDADHANAVDGLNGGSYPLVNPLIFSGDVVEFDDVVINDDLTVDDDALVSGDLTVGGSLNLVGTAFLGTVAATTVSAGTVSTGVLTASGAAAFNGHVTLGNAGSDVITLLGQMRFKTRMGTDTAEVLTPSDSCQFIFSEALTTSRTWTLSGTFDAGQWFWLYNRSGVGRDLSFLGVTLEHGEGLFVVYTGADWRVLAQV
jgi:hypothetical protein